MQEDGVGFREFGQPSGYRFATGIERLILNLKKQNVAVPGIAVPQVYIAYLGDLARPEAFKLAAQLRQAGLGALVTAGARSLKSQMRQANTCGIPFAVIIGEDEVRSGTVVLRDMRSASQQTVAPADLPPLLK